MKALNVLQSLFTGFLGISPDRIWAYNNDVDIPKDKGMYVVLELDRVEPFANNIRYPKPNVDSDLSSTQDIQIKTEVICHFVSRDATVRENLVRIMASLGSDLCQRLSEENQVHISRISDFVDASAVEGVGELTRFDVRVRVISGETIETVVPYYDQYEPSEILIEQ